ncbi:MAG: DUF58 domain-containing protein [Flavobacteriales bacterium]
MKNSLPARIFTQLRINRRAFLVLGGVAVVFVLAFVFDFIYPAGMVLLFGLSALFLVDGWLLFQPAMKFNVHRHTGKLLSLGDPNPIVLRVRSKVRFALRVQVFEELPVQLQQRNFKMDERFAPLERKVMKYHITPNTRGNYGFGDTNLIVSTQIGLLSRRVVMHNSQNVAVFPSVIQMKKYELMAFARISTFEGIKKVRRLGHSYEFEQIKTYVTGDDIRSINWKATSRRNQLMVNQYEDERSQPIYSIIDKSRSMHMPFNGLSLLDYAINTSLVLSNIALKKHDKAGLVSFSSTIGSTLPAERASNQLKKILAALYNEKSFLLEANYDLLYRAVKNVVKSRSLIFLYTNFESPYAMERALPVLRKINATHLLVVMIFENTELMAYSRREAAFVTDIYTQTMADKLVLEKKHMVMKLKMHGIQTILTRPEDLSINTVNKYLELKARGLI